MNATAGSKSSAVNVRQRHGDHDVGVVGPVDSLVVLADVTRYWTAHARRSLSTGARTPAKRSSLESPAPGSARPATGRGSSPPRGRPRRARRRPARTRTSRSGRPAWRARAAPACGPTGSRRRRRLVVIRWSMPGRSSHFSSYGDVAVAGEQRLVHGEQAGRSTRPSSTASSGWHGSPSLGIPVRVARPLEREHGDVVHLEVVGVRVAALVVAVGDDDLRALAADDPTSRPTASSRSARWNESGCSLAGVSGMPESR